MKLFKKQNIFWFGLFVNICFFIFIIAILLKIRQNNQISNFLLPYKYVNTFSSFDFTEASGITFNSQTNTLFIVGDEGYICEITKQGDLIKQKKINNEDFEDITYNGFNNKLYVIVEGQDCILEIDSQSFDITNTLFIEWDIKDKKLKSLGKEGLEGITFVFNENEKFFYIVDQVYKNNKQVSVVFKLSIDFDKSKSIKKITIVERKFLDNIIDISAIHYNQKNNSLYLVSDYNNILLQMTKDLKFKKIYALPGKEQEGITIDDFDFLYIAQDLNKASVIKLKLRNFKKREENYIWNL